ncbi:MAG: polysaccharide biosynthesis C-terminal domain-containing protein [Fodinibius sp.]|nr:polysaccharide biosynthesis C-terminal domain-containing protein [Fodinibius sp.]
MFGITTATMQAGSADFFYFMNEGDKNAVLQQSKRMFNVFSLVSFRFVCLSYEIGSLLYGRAEYNSAIGIISIVAIGYYFYGIYQFSSRLIFYNQNIYISAITLIALLINIVLNVIFIPKYGYKAAAITTLFSYFMMPFLGSFVLKLKNT